MDPLLILLRMLHVGLGALWVGTQSSPRCS
jgi:hypothetical protein